MQNNQQYTFALNGRIDGGPGGTDATASATPRLGGTYWISQAVDTLATPTLRAVTYGIYNDTAARLITPYYLGVGDDNALYSGSLHTTRAGQDISVAWKPLTNLSALPAGTPLSSTAFAYSQGRFILAGGTTGTGPVAYTSADLTTWTASTFGTASTQAINALATDGTTVVAVGDGGSIWTASWSSGAIKWNAQTSNTSQNLYGVVRGGNGIWIAVGAQGTLLTSWNAGTWNVVSTGLSNDLHSVTVAPMLQDNPTCARPLTTIYRYAAVGQDGTILSGKGQGTTTPTWNVPGVKPSGAPHLRAVVAANQQIYHPFQVIQPARQMLALGADGTVWTSPDGDTWSAPTQTQAATGTFTGLAYLQGLYVALGNAGTIFYSH